MLVSSSLAVLDIVWLRCEIVKEWHYGLTLLPREANAEEEDTDPTVEAIVRSRQDLGWELVRVTERADAELLIFRRPA